MLWGRVAANVLSLHLYESLTVYWSSIVKISASLGVLGYVLLFADIGFEVPILYVRFQPLGFVGL